MSPCLIRVYCEDKISILYRKEFSKFPSTDQIVFLQLKQNFYYLYPWRHL